MILAWASPFKRWNLPDCKSESANSRVHPSRSTFKQEHFKEE